MRNKIYIAVILLLTIIVAYLYFTKPTNEIDRNQVKIDSLSVLIKNHKIEADSLIEKVITITEVQNYYEKKADSLQGILDNTPHTCEETVINQAKQITYLHTSLDACKESKVIQTKTIGVQSEIIINLEVKGIESIKLCENKSNASNKKSFVAGALSVLVIVASVLILI